MPTHFQTIQEFRDLITVYGASEVIVSQDDFNFLWDRVDPAARYKRKYTIMILNNRDEEVRIITKLTGTLDLTNESIVFQEKEQ